MSALIRFIPSAALALAGAGLQLGDYRDPTLGKALLIGAAVLAVIGIASLWIQQYIELRAARASLRHELPQNPQEITQLREQVEQLKAERDALREEKHQNLQDQRRRRIEDWRTFIQNFDFDTGKFAHEDTYADMRQYLQPEVIEMFEASRGFHVGNEARGDSPYKHTLLEEVLRIEREWGLI